MLGSVIAAVYRPLSATSCRQRPWQIAAAVALGALCGMLLPYSPLGGLALMLLFFLPLHLPLAILSTLLMAVAVGLLEPMAGNLGVWLQRVEAIAKAVIDLERYPLVAWLRLNNSVVQGMLLLGLIQLLPTFALMRKLAEQLSIEAHSPLHGLRLRFDAPHAFELTPSIANVVPGLAKTSIQSTAPTSSYVEEMLSSKADIQTPAAGQLPSDTHNQENLTEHLSEESTTLDSLHRCLGRSSSALSPQQVANRAAELAALVDEMLNDLQEQPPQASESMDNVRLFAVHAAETRVADKRTYGSDQAEVDLAGLEKLPPTANPATVAPSAGAQSGAIGGSSVARTTSSTGSVAHHEEALRYLLHHLKEIKDKV